MATTLYRNTIRRHGEKRKPLQQLASAFILFSVLGLFVLVSLDTLDKNIYPGCKILNQSEIGNILEIKINPEIDDGTDTGCLETARIIQKICEDGYRVYYWGRVIDLDEAYQLVAFTGEPFSIISGTMPEE